MKGLVSCVVYEALMLLFLISELDDRVTTIVKSSSKLKRHSNCALTTKTIDFEFFC